MAIANTNRAHRTAQTFLAVDVDELIEDSQYFRDFAVQVIGGEAANGITVWGSLDGTNYVQIHDPAVVTAAAPGVYFQFSLPVALRGGIKVKFTNNGLGALVGTIFTSMEGNAISKKSFTSG